MARQAEAEARAPARKGDPRPEGEFQASAKLRGKRRASGEHPDRVTLRYLGRPLTGRSPAPTTAPPFPVPIDLLPAFLAGRTVIEGSRRK